MKVRKQYKECKKLKLGISNTVQFRDIKIFNINILELYIRSYDYHNNHYTTRLPLYQIINFCSNKGPRYSRYYIEFVKRHLDKMDPVNLGNFVQFILSDSLSGRNSGVSQGWVSALVLPRSLTCQHLWAPMPKLVHKNISHIGVSPPWSLTCQCSWSPCQCSWSPCPGVHGPHSPILVPWSLPCQGAW